MTPKAEGLRTVAADKSVRDGRLAKARQFLLVADDARELAGDVSVSDAAATLYIHAGIAAADAICATALGKHAKGQDHHQAVTLLERVDREAAKWLSTLLAAKTRAGYGHDAITDPVLVRLQRAAQSLVDRASQ